MKNLKIETANSEEHFNHIRNLLNTFIEWHFKRHSEDSELIAQYFDKESFQKELRDLPGKYIAPDGALLIAYYDDLRAGCVALRRIDEMACEMKRMFVFENFHGKGVGKALAKSIISEAKKLDYRKIYLDTSFRQIEAQSLYASLGFQICEPYYNLPENLKNWLVFMQLTLTT